MAQEEQARIDAKGGAQRGAQGGAGASPSRQTRDDGIGSGRSGKKKDGVSCGNKVVSRSFHILV